MPARKFGIWDLWRLALWGVAAAGALSAVTYAGSTGIGRERFRTAIADIHEALLPSGIEKPHMLSAEEGRRLAETVRTLTEDRQRLQTRIATLERSVDDITGSIARVQQAAEAAQRPPPPSEPQPEAAPPATQPPEEVTSSITVPAQSSNITVSAQTPSITVPAQTPTVPQSAPSITKPEFGLDLGSATTVEALRLAWTIALRKHGKLLEGLQPIVHKRERPRGSGVELRLVAGPLPNATTAARICAAMTAAGAICQPSTFEGQRLALH